MATANIPTPFAFPFSAPPPPPSPQLEPHTSRRASPEDVKPTIQSAFDYPTPTSTHSKASSAAASSPLSARSEEEDEDFKPVLDDQREPLPAHQQQSKSTRAGPKKRIIKRDDIKKETKNDRKVKIKAEKDEDAAKLAGFIEQRERVPSPSVGPKPKIERDQELPWVQAGLVNYHKPYDPEKPTKLRRNRPRISDKLNLLDIESFRFEFPAAFPPDCPPEHLENYLPFSRHDIGGSHVRTHCPPNVPSRMLDSSRITLDEDLNSGVTVPGRPFFLWSGNSPDEDYSVYCKNEKRERKRPKADWGALGQKGQWWRYWGTHQPVFQDYLTKHDWDNATDEQRKTCVKSFAAYGKDNGTMEWWKFSPLSYDDSLTPSQREVHVRWDLENRLDEIKCVWVLYAYVGYSGEELAWCMRQRTERRTAMADGTWGDLKKKRKKEWKAIEKRQKEEKRAEAGAAKMENGTPALSTSRGRKRKADALLSEVKKEEE